MMYKIPLVLLLCVSALRAKPNFVNCGSEAGNYDSISVSDCTDDQQTCILKRNTNVTIEIKFYVYKDTSSVTAVVHGVLSGMPVPFPIAHPNACETNYSGLTCPLSKDVRPYTYTTTMFVEKAYPKLALQVKWQLKNQDSQDIVCVNIPAKIQ